MVVLVVVVKQKTAYEGRISDWISDVCSSDLAKQASGTQFERDYGENVSRKVACGYVGVAGHDVYVNTFGKANRLLQQVYAISDFPCDGLSRVWAGGKEIQLTQTAPNTYRPASGQYVDHLTF